MILRIFKYPDPKLKKRTKPVSKISKEIFQLTDDMIETMLQIDGVGLAANQVGSDLRIFVINTSPSDEKPQPIVVINPEILNQQGETVDDEGCLSFPELYLRIARPAEVRIHAKNLYNESFILETTGILARAVMHEIDHLNGILFIEHADKTEQDKINEYLKKIDLNNQDS